MDLHREIILSVISRCRVSSLRETLLLWGRLSSEHLNEVMGAQGGTGTTTKTKFTKRQVAEHIIQIFKKYKLTDDIVGDLELAYMQLHSRSKMWLAYCLEGSNVCLNLDPRTLRSKVLHSLQLKWKSGHIYGNMKLFAGAVWLRVNLGQNILQRKESKVYNHNNSVFVITFPGSPYVFMNKTSTKLLKVVTEAVIDAVNAVNLKDIKLSGHHVSSLADIVLNKDNKILLSKYREKEEIENPLLSRQERKRKTFEDNFTDTIDMIDENRQEKRMRKTILENKFGSEPQPVLEKLEYKFTLKFRGNPACDTECKNSVEIKGTSVLEGLYQLASKGLVKFPLPKHLTTATKMARNSFIIESARKQ